jgi:hypothetical protein
VRGEDVSGRLEMLLDVYRLRKAVGRIENPCLIALVEFSLGSCLKSRRSLGADDRERAFVMEALSYDLVKN